MRFIISPAKKMVPDDDFAWRDLPRFVDDAAILLARMREMDPAELQRMWKCSDALARFNIERLSFSDLHTGLTPAVFTYDGIQYRHLAPRVMTEAQLEYLQEHLRILSGFYGILAPFDGVTPYRLEMQAKIDVGDATDLYSFWGTKLVDSLAAETDTIVNLASVEYARAVVGSPIVERRRADMPKTITCLFGDIRDGKLVQRATQAKAARGMFMRWCAEHAVDACDSLTDFDDAGYGLYAPLSTDDTLVFARKG